MMFLLFVFVLASVYWYRVKEAYQLSKKCVLSEVDGVTVVMVPTTTVGAACMGMGFQQSLRLRVYSFLGAAFWVFNPKRNPAVDALRICCIAAYVAAKKNGKRKQVVLAMPSKYELDARAEFMMVSGKVYSSKEFGAAVLAHELVHGRRMLERDGYWATAREHFEEEIEAYAAGWKVLGVELPHYVIAGQAFQSCAFSWPSHELSEIRQEVEELLPEYEYEYEEDSDSDFMDYEYSEDSSEDDSDDEEWGF